MDGSTPRFVHAPDDPPAAPWPPPAPLADQQVPLPPATPARPIRWGGVVGIPLAVGAVALAGLAVATRDDGSYPRNESVLTLYAAEEGVVGDATFVRDGSTAATDRVLHDELWAEWSEMIPPYWSRRVARFEIASDGQGGVAAAVQRLDEEGERWLLSVDPVDAVELRDDYVHTLVHELAHIVTLGEGRVTVERSPAGTLVEQAGRCSGPPVPFGCAAEGSTIAAFAEEFWDLDALAAPDGIATTGDREAATIERYLARRDSFVSAYAASDPVEDLAETFTAMTLGQAQPRGSVAAAKIEFVRADPELFALADRIRAALRD